MTRLATLATPAVPGGAKLLPKTVAMALAERAVTNGVLRPAPTTPPLAMAAGRVWAGAKSAFTLLGPFIATVQEPVPVQLPSQPVKTYPVLGTAWRVTLLPAF